MKNLFCNTNVTTPEVDNDAIPCEKFVDSDCVILENIQTILKTYFSLGDTPTLTETINNIGFSLKDARERITTIENTCCDGGTEPEPNIKDFIVEYDGFSGFVFIGEDGVITHNISTDATEIQLDINKVISAYISEDSFDDIVLESNDGIPYHIASRRSFFTPWFTPIIITPELYNNLEKTGGKAIIKIKLAT